MSELFTLEQLLNNLYKNFPEIIGIAIQKYIEFDKIEKTLMTNLIHYKTTTEVNKENTNKIITFLILYSNCIQYGKSYFLNEIIQNIMEMQTLTSYINTFKTNDVNPGIKTPTKIEELNSDSDSEQKGGVNSIRFFMNFVCIFLLSELTNVTSVATSMSTDFVSTNIPLNLEIDIQMGKIPSIQSPIQKKIQPTPEEIGNYTKLYDADTEIPDDTTISANITELFQPQYIDGLIKQESPYDFVYRLANGNMYGNLFVEEIQQNVARVNNIVSETYNTLEEMCISFTEITDRRLPIQLYEIFNSKLASKLDELQKQSELKIKDAKDKLMTEELDKYSIQASDYATFIPTLSSISNLFSWSSSETVKSTEDPLSSDHDGLTKKETDEIVYGVETSIKNQIATIQRNVDIEIIQSFTDKINKELREEYPEDIKVINLKTYLTAICKVKKPKYVFDKITGLLYITDPTRSRFHLLALAQNVMQYYDTVIKGISYIENGEVIVDIPDSIRLKNINSLREKSELIIEVFTEYAVELTRTLAEGHSYASNYQEFFQNIEIMWNSQKTRILEATTEFPISERKSKKQMKQSEEEAERIRQELYVEHHIKMQDAIQQLATNADNTNITKHQIDQLNQYLMTYFGGALNTGSNAINLVVNATSNVGANVVDNADILKNKFISSIMSIIWAFVKVSMLLSIPAFIFIAFRSGFVSSVFSKIAKKITNPNETPLQNTRIEVRPNLSNNEINIIGSHMLDNSKAVQAKGGNLSHLHNKNKQTRKNQKSISIKKKTKKRCSN
jgi:hypothetical protein